MSYTVLVTGANGGFGKLTIEALLSKGHQVIASMRNIEGKNKAASDEFKSKGCHVVEMDVTDESSVENAIKDALKAKGKIDVLINNAGIGVLGLQETFTADDWKKLFDVNVFGVQRVNRAILPEMRKNKSGLLIHISSLLGRMTVPFYGPYNASKWALEAMAENYRTELTGFGVDCCIVEPGGYPTSFIDSLIKPSDEACKTSYGMFAHAPEGFLDGFEEAMAKNPAQNPQDVADAIVNVIETPAGERPFRTIVDKMGMGDALKPYNEQLHQLTSNIYNAFGIGHMLELKKGQYFINKGLNI